MKLFLKYTRFHYRGIFMTHYKCMTNFNFFAIICVHNFLSHILLTHKHESFISIDYFISSTRKSFILDVL